MTSSAPQVYTHLLADLRRLHNQKQLLEWPSAGLVGQLNGNSQWLSGGLMCEGDVDEFSICHGHMSQPCLTVTCLKNHQQQCDLRESDKSSDGLQQH